jgi:hypothetical protein
MTGPTILNNDTVLKNTEDWSKSGGQTLLMPIALAPDEIPEIAAQRVIDNYAVQLGGIPISEGKPIVTPQKYFYERK